MEKTLTTREQPDLYGSTVEKTELAYIDYLMIYSYRTGKMVGATTWRLFRATGEQSRPNAFTKVYSVHTLKSRRKYVYIL